jgi:hypothetical protein
MTYVAGIGTLAAMDQFRLADRVRKFRPGALQDQGRTEAVRRGRCHEADQDRASGGPQGGHRV